MRSMIHHLLFLFTGSVLLSVATLSCDNTVDGHIYYPLPYEVAGAKFINKGEGISYADIPSTGTTVVWSMQPDNKYINLSTYLAYAKSASSLEQLFSSPTIENPHPYNVDLHFDATSAYCSILIPLAAPDSLN